MTKLSIITTTFLLMFVGFQNANAQIEFGVKGGVNLTSWSLDSSIEDVENFGEASTEAQETFSELKDADYKIGLHAGVYAMLDMGAFTITPELLYSQKGSKDAYTVTRYEIVNNVNTATETSTQSTKWDYISVPVMFGIQLFDVVGLQLGPQVGYLLSSEYKSDFDEYNYEENLDDDEWSLAGGGTYKRTYGNFDFGVALGVTFDVSGRINAGVRYTHGLGSVIKEDYTRTVGNQDSKTQNRTLQAFIGVPLFTTER